MDFTTILQIKLVGALLFFAATYLIYITGEKIIEFTQKIYHHFHDLNKNHNQESFH